MDERQLSDSEARNLRFLRTLVTVLTATMILGVLTVVALLVIRLQAPSPTLPVLPAEVSLPAGVEAEAVTFGDGWLAVVTNDDRILIFDATTGAPRGESRIMPAN